MAEVGVEIDGPAGPVAGLLVASVVLVWCWCCAGAVWQCWCWCCVVLVLCWCVVSAHETELKVDKWCLLVMCIGCW